MTRPPEALETDLRLADRRQRQQFEERAYSPVGDQEIAAAIFAEVERAKRHGIMFASLHEAYAVLLEEMDEVWDCTRMKRRERNPLELRKEFIQIAAMAVKALQSMPNFTGGSV